MAQRRAEQRSIVAKVRVYELAKEFGVESKAVMAELEKMGEFVRSASSTIEAPVVRRLKEAFSAEAPRPAPAKKAGADGQNGSRKAPAGQANGATDGAVAAAPAAPAAAAPAAASPAGPAAPARPSGPP